jgi:hypothetical protein
VLILGGSMAALALALATSYGLLQGQGLAAALVLPVLVFVLAIADQGIKLGRSTHVVDMAEPSRRAAYTALSNTITGIATLGAGIFGLVVQLAGETVLLALFTAMALLAVWLARGLEDVQQQ